MKFRCVACLVVLLLALPLVIGAHIMPSFFYQHESREPLLPAVPPVRRADVYELKVRLAQLGYYSGPLDEVYDAAAVQSVREFQKAYWLQPSGVVDDATWRALAQGIDRPVRVWTGPRPDGTVSLEVDTEKAVLTVLIDGKPWKTYPVAVGSWSSLTPVGEWKVIDKGVAPGGAFGTRWIALDVPWGGYGIHGTNRPWSIGSHVSNGCIRMFNEDVEEVFDLVTIGTIVRVKGIRPQLNLDREFLRGAVGPEVVLIQEALRKLGFDAGRCDGDYGESTARSVQEVTRVFEIGRGDRVTRDLLKILGLR